MVTAKLSGMKWMFLVALLMLALSSVGAQPSAVVEVTSGTVTLHPASPVNVKPTPLILGVPTPVFFEDVIVAEPGSALQIIIKDEARERRVPLGGKAWRWSAPQPPAEASPWSGFFSMFSRDTGSTARAGVMVRNATDALGNDDLGTRFLANSARPVKLLPRTQGFWVSKSGRGTVTLSAYAQQGDGTAHHLLDQPVKGGPGLVKVPFPFEKWSGRTLTLYLLSGENTLDELVLAPATVQEVRAIEEKLAELKPENQESRAVLVKALSYGAGFLPPIP